MAQQPRPLDPQASPLHYLGAQIRHWRQQRQLSQAELGTMVRWSTSMVSKFEKAERRPTPQILAQMDTALKTGGALKRLWDEYVQCDTDKANDAPAQEERERYEWPHIADAATAWWRRAAEANQPHIAFDSQAPVAQWTQRLASLTSLERSGPRCVGAADVEGLWVMCDSMAAADHRLGGGFTRPALSGLLAHTAFPLLRHGSFDDTTGRELVRVSARLCDLAGFVAFDACDHGAGQTWFSHALSLARATGDHALCGHILADMAMQCVHLRHTSQAAALAQAGQDAAKEASSQATLARCAAVEARAHARAGNARHAIAAMNVAETATDRIRGDDEPAWVKFFNHQQLSTELTYAFHDLGLNLDEFSPPGDDAPMRRRGVLLAATFADSHLTKDQDVGAACTILTATTSVLPSMTSTRAHDAINAVRARLSAHATHPAVQAVEDRFTHPAPQATP